jgi:hypothetical protein
MKKNIEGRVERQEKDQAKCILKLRLVEFSFYENAPYKLRHRNL